MGRLAAMGYVLLGIALVLNAAANILLKLGSKNLHGLKELSIGEAIPRLLTNYYLICGLTFFALNVLFYASALNRLNLSVAYPIMGAGAIVIITVFSAISLREAISVWQYVGLSFIAFGIILVTSQAK